MNEEQWMNGWSEEDEKEVEMKTKKDKEMTSGQPEATPARDHLIHHYIDIPGMQCSGLVSLSIWK